MFPQSKILVWYQIASQKVVLGEAICSENFDVHSLWRRTEADYFNDVDMGYRLSLFDDGGREVAGKAVSVSTADKVLSGCFSDMNKASV